MSSQAYRRLFGKPKSKGARSAAMALAVGFIVIWFVPICSGSGGCGYWQQMGVYLLLAMASAMFGMFNGFLFGIPKSIKTIAGKEGEGDANGAQPRRFMVNTNLEDISDWITKIIVALGIVQLMKLPGLFVRVADYVKGHAGCTGMSESIIISVMLYFGIVGFLYAYLFTRFFLPREWEDWEDKDKNAEIALEGAINGYLYRPGMYPVALELAAEYNRRFGDSNARVSVYTACAYGQQYGALDDQARQASTDIPANALKAMQNAFRLDPGSIKLMHHLWYRPRMEVRAESRTQDPDDQTDLFPFFELEEFKKFFSQYGYAV